MSLSAAETYLLELINRARLDPAAEARRYGIGLNDGLDAGTIGSKAKAVLAPNEALARAAEGHSKWMLDNDAFGHSGAGGSRAGDRMAAAGYDFRAPWAWGENVALLETRSLNAAVSAQHADLFESASHRVNLLADRFREIGIGQVAGSYTYAGRTFDASALTENFASSGTARFVTGVAYRDRDGDGFYSIGEGTGGLRLALGGADTATAPAGSYSLRTSAATAEVAITGGGADGRVRLDMSDGNVKLDLVNGNMLLSSGDTTLLSGLHRLRLLGVAPLSATGSGAGDTIEGNATGNAIGGRGGNDILRGKGGSDRLWGDAGNDRLEGGTGHDQLYGGDGHDTLLGEAGDDRAWGGAGNDRLVGGAGNDRLRGEAGNDTLLGDDGVDELDGGAGNDHLEGDGGRDTLRGGEGDDRLYGDGDGDSLWGGAGTDRLSGGAGNDKLRGEAGHDRLLGGAGNDNLSGGAGNDTLSGDAGADTFIFARGDGRDVFTDFAPWQGDRLRLDDALWGGGLGVSAMVDRFDRVEGGDLILDFGNGHSLRFEDFTDLGALKGAIDLF